MASSADNGYQADPRGEWPVVLVEAFYHPAFGVVLWHDYPDHDGSFVMSARLNDESKAQDFVDCYRLEMDALDKPDFSAN